MYATLAFIASSIALTCMFVLLRAVSRIRKLESAIDRLTAQLTDDSTQPEPPRGMRRWLTFRVSTLLIATTLAGCILGIFASERTASQRQASAVQRLQRVGAAVSIQHSLPGSQPELICGFGGESEMDPAPTWVRYALGDHFGCRIRRVEFSRLQLADTMLPGSLGCNDADLAVLKDLRDLRYLNLSQTSITDDGLRHVAAVPSLHWLCLRGTAIDGSGIHHLRALRNLRYLDLRGTDFQRKHLKSLQRLSSLESICLPHQATDDWLDEIAACQTLRAVDCENTQVTPAGLQALPDLPKLTSVFLSEASSNADGVKQLQALDTLRVLRLNSESLTAKDFDAIAALKQVKDLDLGAYVFVEEDEDARRALESMRHLGCLRVNSWDGSATFPGSPVTFDLPNTQIEFSESRRGNSYDLGGMF